MAKNGTLTKMSTTHTHMAMSPGPGSLATTHTRSRQGEQRRQCLWSHSDIHLSDCLTVQSACLHWMMSQHAGHDVSVLHWTRRASMAQHAGEDATRCLIISHGVQITEGCAPSSRGVAAQTVRLLFYCPVMIGTDERQGPAAATQPPLWTSLPL